MRHSGQQNKRSDIQEGQEGGGDMLSVALSRYTHVTLRHRICVEIHTWNMSHHGKGVEIQTWNMSRHGVCVEIHTWNMLRHGTLEMGDEFG